MTRYGGFEIQATCGHCGQPLPVNGPMRKSTCTACCQVTTLPSDHIPGFLNDFEEAYEGLQEKQGQGGTMMGSGQTYRYGYYRLHPRCEKCKTALAEVAPGTDGQVFCTECGARYLTYPAPEWLREQVPSAVQIISPERELSPGADQAALSPDQDAAKPILMNCPGCGGGLTITAETERTCTCQFCQAQVFIPDELWKRLHPVKAKQAWFVRFEGPTIHQLNAERRRRDKADEQAELARRGTMQKTKALKTKFNPLTFIGIAAGLLIALAGLVLGTALEMAGFVVPEGLVGASLIGGFIVACMSPAIPALLGTRHGPWKASKQAMIAIAHRYGMEIYGEFEKTYIGSARGKIQGREVTLDPGGDDAIEVDLDERVFYVKTDPNYPSPDDEMWRFTTKNRRFDQLFPIRYASPAIVKRLERSLADLSPIFWFLERWGPRIARMEITYDVKVHLLPGGVGDGMKYLSPQDMEPLLNDLLVLAKALDNVARGQAPELPAPAPAGLGYSSAA